MKISFFDSFCLLFQLSAILKSYRSSVYVTYTRVFLSSFSLVIFFQYETTEDREAIQYITFLWFIRAGLRGLEFYDPATKKHGQAHMRAR